MNDEELERTLARTLDADAPEAPAPERIAALRARAEAGRAARPTGPAPVVGTVPRRGIPPVLAAAATVVALIVGAGVAWLVGRDDDGPSIAGQVEYAGPMAGPNGESAAADLSITATGIGRVVELDTDVLPILPTGDLYEVWFVGPGDAPDVPNRISAGTFHPDPDGRSQVTFAAAVDPDLFPVVEITAEPGDGNPLPTGPVVLRVDLAR